MISSILKATSKPNYSIVIDGKDKTELFQTRIISLTLRDVKGFEADQLGILLDDHDGSLTMPKKGAVIKLQLGVDDELYDKGSYIVDESNHRGPPDVISVTARSADMRESLKIQKYKSWDNVSIEDIVKTIASNHKLKHAVSLSFSTKIIKHLDQTSESDLHFLTRLAKDHGAIAAFKNGTILFLVEGEGKTASGIALETATFTRGDGDQHDYSSVERTGKYTGVQTQYYDQEAAQLEQVLVGKTGTVKTLRRVYASHDEAYNVADAEFKRVGRGAAGLRITLALGQPNLIPEQPATLEGWKDEIIEHDWIILDVTHHLGNGITTAISFETR